MQTFRYKGTSNDGGVVSGTIDAKHSAAALQVLTSRNVSVFELKDAPSKIRRLKTRRPKSLDYFQMIQQLSVLLSAGIPLLDSLDSLKKNVEYQQLVTEIEALRMTLRQGGTLSEGFRTCMPKLPPSVPVLIGLGERTGQLPEVLEILAEQLGFHEELRSDLKGALSYPAFLFAVGVCAVGFLFGFVVPRFSNMLGDKRSDLEGISKLVFLISDVMRDNTGILISMFGGIILALILIWKNDTAKTKAVSIVQKFPGFGPWMRQIEIANWTRLVGVSLTSKADLLESVTLARHTIQSARNRAAFDDVARDLRAGASLSDALQKVPDLEPVVLNLVSTGSRAGQLDKMLMLATEILDKRVRRTAERFGKLAEPIAILVISALVGVVVISLVTAMTSLYDVGLV